MAPPSPPSPQKPGARPTAAAGRPRERTRARNWGARCGAAARPRAAGSLPRRRRRPARAGGPALSPVAAIFSASWSTATLEGALTSTCQAGAFE
jgi:hypothetical protein